VPLDAREAHARAYGHIFDVVMGIFGSGKLKKEKDAEIDRLQTELHSRNAEADKLKNDLHQAHERISRERGQLEHMVQTRTTLEGRLQDLGEEKHTLLLDLDQFSRALHAEQSKAENRDMTIAACNERIEALEHQIERMSTTRTAHHEIASPRSQQTGARHTLNQRTQGSSEELRNTVEELLVVVNNQANEMEEHRKRADRSEAGLADAISRLGAVGHELAEKSDKIRDFSGRNNVLAQEISGQRAELEATKAQLEQSEGLKKQADEAFRKARRQLQTEKQAVREKESALAEFRARVATLEQHASEHSNQLQEARLALNRAQNELGIEKRKAKHAETERLEKSRQLEFVQQRCAAMSQPRARPPPTPSQASNALRSVLSQPDITPQRGMNRREDQTECKNQ